MSIPRNLGNFADNVNVNGKVEVTGINATGTPTGSTALLGNGTWGTVTTSPAGSNTQIQYNNAGAFGASSALTFDGTNLAITQSGNPTMTVKTTGSGNNPLYRLQADTNYWDALGVFSDSNDTLRFRYNGTDYLTLTNTGAIGVGSGLSYGTSGQVLTSAGASAAPTWSDAPAPAAGKLLASGDVTSSSGVTLSWATTGIKRIQVFAAVNASSNFDAYVQIGNTTSVSSASSYTVSRMAIQGTVISGNSSGSVGQWQLTSSVASSPSVLQLEVGLSSNGNPRMKSEIQQSDSTYGLYKAAGFFNANWTQLQSVRVWWDGGNAGRVTVVGFTE
jgi:hypothetical protein